LIYNIIIKPIRRERCHIIVLEKAQSVGSCYETIEPMVEKLEKGIAKKIKDANPNITYGKTNLQDFLIE